MINGKLTIEEKNRLFGVMSVFNYDICEGIYCSKISCDECPMNRAVKAHELFLSELEHLTSKEEE